MAGRRHGDQHASAGRSRHRRVGAGCSSNRAGPAAGRWAGRGAAERYLGSGRNLWPGLSGDRLGCPGGLEPLLRTLAAVRPTSASLVDAAGPVESSEGRCRSSLGVDLGTLLGEALAWAFRIFGFGHADVVLGRRHPLDSDLFLYPDSPFWNSGNDFPQSEPTPILHACELSSQQRKGRGGNEVCPRSPQVLARAFSQLALALRTRQLRPETKKALERVIPLGITYSWERELRWRIRRSHGADVDST